MKELENTVVHLPTQEEFNEYMKMCEKEGWEWMSNESPFDCKGKEWKKYREGTCATIRNKLSHSSMQFYEYTGGYKVITLKELKEMNEEEEEIDPLLIFSTFPKFPVFPVISHPLLKEMKEFIGVNPAKEGSDTTVTSIRHKGELPQYLLDAIEKYKNEPKERTPDDEKMYSFVMDTGGVVTFHAQGGLLDKRRLEQNNFFSTEKEARMHSLRIQGMGVKNTVKKGVDFWIWNFCEKEAKICNAGYVWEYYPTRPKFETKEEAESWGEKYAEAFKFFNK